MGSFRDPTLVDRQTAAAAAKKAALEKFRAQPSPDDPAVLQREAERKAIHDAREQRATERKATAEARKLELARQAQRDRELAEQAERETAEQTEREKTQHLDGIRKLLADQKAARDARYAKRQARR